MYIQGAEEVDEDEDVDDDQDDDQEEDEDEDGEVVDAEDDHGNGDEQDVAAAAGDVSWEETPDGGCLCYALRTGFGSSQVRSRDSRSASV